jgi:hypothetical protein
MPTWSATGTSIGNAAGDANDRNTSRRLSAYPEGGSPTAYPEPACPELAERMCPKAKIPTPLPKGEGWDEGVLNGFGRVYDDTPFVLGYELKPYGASMRTSKNARGSL